MNRRLYPLLDYVVAPIIVNICTTAKDRLVTAVYEGWTETVNNHRPCQKKRRLPANGERASAGAPDGVSFYGYEAIQVVWEHAGVLVKCASYGRSLKF